MPCQRVNTTGRKSFGSWLNRIVAPLETCRSTLLSRWMAPVRKLPGGTITCPPPARLQAAMAAAKAAVFIVVPSPTAPKWVTSKFRGGNHGRRTEATIRSAARSQGGLGGWKPLQDQGGSGGDRPPEATLRPWQGRVRLGQARLDAAGYGDLSHATCFLPGGMGLLDVTGLFTWGRAPGCVRAWRGSRSRSPCWPG